MLAGVTKGLGRTYRCLHVTAFDSCLIQTFRTVEPMCKVNLGLQIVSEAEAWLGVKSLFVLDCLGLLILYPEIRTIEHALWPRLSLVIGFP